MGVSQFNGVTLKQTIKDWFDRSFGATPYEIRLDIGDGRTWYQGIDPANVAKVLSNESRVDRALYRRGYFDCEDFAIASRAAVVHHTLGSTANRFESPPAFGLLFANSHATNIGVATDGTPYIFDWYYDLLWRETSLDGVLWDEIGVGWISPRSIRYILI